jgi:hypothetical protein
MNNEWSDYIAHHGVLGMKWGVHRNRHAEGGFTKRGLKKLDKIASSEKRVKEQTELAKLRLTENSGVHAKHNEIYRKKLARLEKRGKGESEKAKKVKDLIKSGQNAIARNDKLMKDIDSGKLKAGRDFIHQIDFNIGLIDTYSATLKFANPKNDVSTDFIARYGTAYRAR